MNKVREAGTLVPDQRPDCVRERDWAVIVGRRDGRTQADLAAEMGVGRERIRQLEGRALYRLRRAAAFRAFHEKRAERA